MPTRLFFLPDRDTPTLFNVNTPGTKTVTLCWVHNPEFVNVSLPDPYEIRRSDAILPDWLMISYPTEIKNPFIIKIRYDPVENPEKTLYEYTEEFTVRFPGIGFSSYRTFKINVQIVNDEQPEPADNDEEESESNLECSVCVDKYNEDTQLPLTMDCGHSFCERCLKQIKLESVQRGQQFLCPTDRIVTNTGLSSLPVSHHLVALMRKEKAEKQEKEKLIVRDPIVPCAENPKHESSLYCQQCQTTFCQSCFTSIHSYKFNAGHKTVPVTEQPIKIPMCSVHPDQQAESYCTEPHCVVNEVFCRQCSGKHKNHKTQSIKRRCEENSGILKGMIEELNESHDRLDAIWNDTRTVADTFRTDGSMVQNAVKNIEEHFDRRKREAVSKLEGWATSKRMRIMQKADKIYNGLRECETIRKNAEKTYRRKTGLHEDVDSLLLDVDSLAKVGMVPDHLHYFSAYSITDDMSRPPQLPERFIKKEDTH